MFEDAVHGGGRASHAAGLAFPSGPPQFEQSRSENVVAPGPWTGEQESMIDCMPTILVVQHVRNWPQHLPQAHEGPSADCKLYPASCMLLVHGHCISA